MSIAGVARELLVRYLDIWVPAALHSRRATFAPTWYGPADPDTAQAALRVFGEFADRIRGRRLTIALVAPDTTALTGRLDAMQAELGTPAELGVFGVAGAANLPAALTAAQAAGAPLLAYVDATGGDGPELGDLLAAVGTGKPAEALLVLPPGDWTGRREALLAAGFTLTAGVELVEAEEVRLLAFATSSAKSLEAFKNSLWAVDEYAGVRYRDPRDPEGHLLDISLQPHPGPLRRELLAHLDAVGECSVTDLRRFTLTDTVYRAADATQALTSLLTAGGITREPEHGRLGGDVLIRSTG